jgi:hypothetical protein
MIAVARDDQVIRQRPSQALQVGNQWLAAPLQQAFVLAAHALAAATGQQQDRTGQGRIIKGHGGSAATGK